MAIGIIFLLLKLFVLVIPGYHAAVPNILEMVSVPIVSILDQDYDTSSTPQSIETTSEDPESAETIESILDPESAENIESSSSPESARWNCTSEYGDLMKCVALEPQAERPIFTKTKLSDVSFPIFIEEAAKFVNGVGVLIEDKLEWVNEIDGSLEDWLKKIHKSLPKSKIAPAVKSLPDRLQGSVLKSAAKLMKQFFLL